MLRNCIYHLCDDAVPLFHVRKRRFPIQLPGLSKNHESERNQLMKKSNRKKFLQFVVLVLFLAALFVPQDANRLLIAGILSSIYSPPFPHPHRYKHEQYGCCHKKQLIEIYLMWQFRFKKIPRKSNHNREWSCMTLSFAIPCQHIRINDIKNQRRNRWKRILKQQRCNRIHTADHQDVRQDIQDRILNKIQYVHSKS